MLQLHKLALYSRRGALLDKWCNSAGLGNNFIYRCAHSWRPQYAAQLNISVLVLQGTDYNVPYFYVNAPNNVATLPAGRQVNLRYPFRTFLGAGGWNETFHGSKRVVLRCTRTCVTISGRRNLSAFTGCLSPSMRITRFATSTSRSSPTW